MTKFNTTNEIENFDFADACVGEIVAREGGVRMYLANVKIKPENSCNRDIRLMRTNDLELRIADGKITKFVLEGYKRYNADGVLLEQLPDVPVAPEDYFESLKKLFDGMVYSLTKEDEEYRMIVDVIEEDEESTYELVVTGTGDEEHWDRFLNVDSMI